MISKAILFPYYLTLKLRNRLYDKGHKKTYSFDVPIISIGNVAVGGTGKTPMTEMAIRILKDRCRVAVVSAGYKRHSKGFLLVSASDTARNVGDEPLQIKRKFPDAIVAVDSKRERAVRQLLAMPEDVRPEVILLDDGLQYRRLGHSKDIIMEEYGRPAFKDQLLPLGRLRDDPAQIKRADAVVVTKCPDYLDEWERGKMRSGSRLRPEQPIFFSKIKYCPAKAVFPADGDRRYIYSKEVYLFTGIADDRQLVLHLTDSYDTIYHKKYGDHHAYSSMDIRSLYSVAKRNPRVLLLTTEKDAQRLATLSKVPDEVRRRLFYIPVEMEMLTSGEADAFEKFLLEGLKLRNPHPGLLF